MSHHKGDKDKTAPAEADPIVSPRHSDSRRKVFCSWTNYHLTKDRPHLDCLPLQPKLFPTYFEDGSCVVLLNIIEVLSKRIMSRLSNLNPKTVPEKLVNVEHCLEHIKEKVYAPHLNANLIVRGNEVAIYDVLLTLATVYPLGYPNLSKEDAKKELIQWLNGRLKTVKLTNLAEDFKSGIALCELVNSFKENIIPTKKISQKGSKKNLTLCFETAERELGIPHILDIEDVYKKPDESSIMLYLGFFKEKAKIEEPDILQQIKEMKKSTTVSKLDIKQVEIESHGHTVGGDRKVQRSTSVKEVPTQEEPETLQRALTQRDPKKKKIEDTPNEDFPRPSKAASVKPKEEANTPTKAASVRSPPKSDSHSVTKKDLEILSQQGLIRREDINMIWTFLGSPDKQHFSFPPISPLGATMSPRGITPIPMQSFGSLPSSPSISALSPRSKQQVHDESSQIVVTPLTDAQIAGLRPHQIGQIIIHVPSFFLLNFLVVKGTSKPGGPLAFNILEMGNNQLAIQFVPTFSGNHAIAITYKGRQVSGSPVGFVVPDCPGLELATLADPAQLSKILIVPTNGIPGVPLSLNTSPVFNHQFLPLENLALDHIFVDIQGPVPTPGYVTQILVDRSIHFGFTPAVTGVFHVQVFVHGRPIFPEPTAITIRGPLDPRVSPASELEALLSGMGF